MTTHENQRITFEINGVDWLVRFSQGPLYEPDVSHTVNYDIDYAKGIITLSGELTAIQAVAELQNCIGLVEVAYASPFLKENRLFTIKR